MNRLVETYKQKSKHQRKRISQFQIRNPTICYSSLTADQINKRHMAECKSRSRKHGGKNDLKLAASPKSHSSSHGHVQCNKYNTDTKSCPIHVPFIVRKTSWVFLTQRQQEGQAPCLLLLLVFIYYHIYFLCNHIRMHPCGLIKQQ